MLAMRWKMKVYSIKLVIVPEDTNTQPYLRFKNCLFKNVYFVYGANKTLTSFYPLLGFFF